MNFWGDSDDVEPLPDWMNPKLQQQQKNVAQSFKGKSNNLTEAINAALAKPSLPQVEDRPDNISNNH